MNALREWCAVRPHAAAAAILRWLGGAALLLALVSCASTGTGAGQEPVESVPVCSLGSQNPTDQNPVNGAQGQMPPQSASCASAGLDSGAQPSGLAPPEPEQAYSGRMWVQVVGAPSHEGDNAQSQSWSAPFDLRGGPLEGELTFFSPFGTTAVRVQWDAAGAQWEAGSKSAAYATIDMLLERELGMQISIRNLFDWLAGVDSAAEGWRTQGVVERARERSFTRTQPQPEIRVRVRLDEAS